jgi:hypothetical protein
LARLPFVGYVAMAALTLKLALTAAATAALHRDALRVHWLEA